MAMEIDFLMKLLDQLVDVYAVCEDRKTQCEHKCQAYRQLLKPWPPTKKLNTTETNPKDKTQDLPVGKPSDEELAMMNPELKMADKLLAKAYTVREKQTKKSNPSENDTTKAVSTVKPSQDANPQGPVAQASHPSKPKDSSRAASAPRIPSSKSQHSLSSSANKNNVKRRGSDGMVVVNQKPSTAGSGKSVGVVSQSQVNKLLGQKGRSASTKAAHVHMRAPFQTQPQPRANTRRQRPNSNKPRSAKVHPASKQEAGKLNKLASGTRDIEMKNPNSGYCDQNQTPSAEMSKTVDHGEMEKTQNYEQEKSSKFVCDTERTQGVEDVVNGFTKMQLADSTQTSMPAEIFTLKNQGNTLSLPAKLRRAYACNRRLRQKATQSVLTVNVKKKSNSADNFLQNVENSFFQGCDGPCGQLFQRAMLMCGAFSHLKQLLESLSTTSISKNSHWVEVLHAKRTADFVIHSFRSLESEYKQLLKDLNCSQASPTPSRVPFSQPERCDIWLPGPLRKVQLPVACNLQYSQPHQMETCSRLLHEVQLLQLQLVVMDAVAKEMLPCLQSLDPTDRSYKCLYRSTYSLLCCDGGAMPALVQDSMDSPTPEPDVNDF